MLADDAVNDIYSAQIVVSDCLSLSIIFVSLFDITATVRDVMILPK